MKQKFHEIAQLWSNIFCNKNFVKYYPDLIFFFSLIEKIRQQMPKISLPSLKRKSDDLTENGNSNHQKENDPTEMPPSKKQKTSRAGPKSKKRWKNRILSFDIYYYFHNVSKFVKKSSSQKKQDQPYVHIKVTNCKYVIL